MPNQPDPMAAYRPAHFSPPPRETGSTYADGMAAIAYVVGNLDMFGAEFELSPRQLAAAIHVAPVATAYRDDESPAVLARISRAVDNIAARQRRIAAIERQRQTAPPARQDAPSAPSAGPSGPRVPVPTPPPTRPPMAPAVSPRTYVPQDAERIAF